MPIKVQAGQTLSQIAKLYGVSVKELQDINGIKDPNKIRAGQILQLNRTNEDSFNANTVQQQSRVTKPSSLSSSQTQTRVYTIQKGENLSTIAKNNGITLQQLLNANPHLKKNPDSVKAGQKINLPSAGETNSAQTPKTKAASTTNTTSTTQNISLDNTKVRNFASKHPYDIKNNNFLKSYIMQKEGFRAKVYDDKGKFAIGYGHRGPVDGKKLTANSTITKEKAIKVLEDDIKTFQNLIKNSVKVPLTQNQFDALTSLAYNIGPNNFKSSTLLKKLNSGDYKEAAKQFEVWNKATVTNEKTGKPEKIVLQGLVNRRKAEQELFLKDLPK